MIRVGPSFTIYANPAPLLVSRQAVFPGLLHLGGTEILAMFAVGQAFDAADMRMEVSHSSNDGESWSAPVPLHADRTALESESFKPTRLPDGRLIATGYVFERPDMMTPVVDPETLELLPLRNRVSWSEDKGRSWSTPRNFSVEGAALELSGPAICTSDGRLLAAAAPFHLRGTGQEGWLIESRDQGVTWHRLSVFYRARGGDIAPWEARLAEIAPGRIVVIFWAYDVAAQLSKDNHIAVSEDGGQSFGPAIATGITAQASNIMAVAGHRVLTIHAHRTAPVGLIVREVDLEAGFTVVSEAPVGLAPVGLAPVAETTTGDIAGQFGSLKFGQPSLTRHSDSAALAAWWQIEAGQHVIKGARISFGRG